MVTRDEVLNLVRSKGPVVPSDITSQLGENSFIVGAFLSELVSSKLLTITHAKLGGSPLYYLESQKAQLSRLYDYLNEKDRRAYDALKENQVMLDDPQTPLMKTCLRAISDFSVPFKVSYNGRQFLFWKWYLASNETIQEKVKLILTDLFPPKPKSVPIVEEKKQEQEKEVLKSAEENVKKAEKSIVESKPIEKVELSQKAPVQNKISPQKFIKPQKEIKNTDPIQKNLQTTYVQEKIEDEFLNAVKGYLNSLKITILESKLIKKNSEAEFIIEIPTTIGSLSYFCRAKNKKRSNEGDIASAYVEGQTKSLPVLYISKGDIPKKVTTLLTTKYKNLKVLKI